MRIPKFRFRYNGLLAFCIVLTAILSIQNIRITKLENNLQKYATIKQSRQHAQYSNYNIGQLEMMVRDANIMAKAAMDKADTTRHRYEWIIGLTTDQVDSVRRISERLYR